VFEIPALQQMKEKAREGRGSRQSGHRIGSLTKRSNICFCTADHITKKDTERKF